MGDELVTEEKYPDRLYTKDEVREFHEKFLMRNGEFLYRYIRGLPKQLKEDIKEISKCHSDNTIENLYWICNDNVEYKYCAHCEKPIEFCSFVEGYKYDCCSKNCLLKYKKTKLITRTNKELTEWGYKSSYCFMDNNGHICYELIAPCCGHVFISKYANIRKNHTDEYNICPKCGAKRRMEKCLAGYMDKYGADYNLEFYEDYGSLVYQMSNTNYKKYKHIVNPENLPIGRKEYHLDHIVPVILCFKLGIPVEIASSVDNLTMLYWYDNLSKGRKLFRQGELLLQKWGYLDVLL